VTRVGAKVSELKLMTHWSHRPRLLSMPHLSSGEWQRTAGRLTMTVAPGAYVKPGHQVVVSILLVNPISAQAPVAPTISAEVRWPSAGPPPFARIPPFSLETIRVGGGQLLAASTPRQFTRRTIHEATQVSDMCAATSFNSFPIACVLPSAGPPLMCSDPIACCLRVRRFS
jgi:hypothetical protein